MSSLLLPVARITRRPALMFHRALPALTVLVIQLLLARSRLLLFAVAVAVAGKHLSENDRFICIHSSCERDEDSTSSSLYVMCAKIG